MSITSSFLGNAQQSGLSSTTVTFSAEGLGTATSDRVVVVGATYLVVPVDNTPTCSIDGIAASILSTTSTGNLGSTIYAAQVPTGTSGDIVLTKTGNTFNRAGVGWWNMTGGQASVYSANSKNTTVDTSVLTVVSVASGGAAFSAAGDSAGEGSDTATWTGLATTDWNATISGFVDHSGAHDSFSSQSNSKSITVAWTGTINNLTIVAASFQPASVAATVSTHFQFRSLLGVGL